MLEKHLDNCLLRLEAILLLEGKVDLLEAMFSPDIWISVLNKGADKTIPLVVLQQWSSVQKRTTLLNDIIAGTYFIKPPAVKKIPKDNGKYREIYVNTPDDRVVLAAVNQAFYKLYDASLAPSCKAYREGRSCAKTVREVAKHLLYGYKLDLSKYFDSVSHEVINYTLAELDTGSPLEKVLYDYYNDDTVYINNVLSSRFKSLAQGCAVSSFLANYILKDVDFAMQDVCEYYCRYSDDMLILCKTEMQATKALAVLETMLRDLGLELNPNKIEYITPDKEYRFLGFGVCGRNITISEKDFLLKKKEVKHACKAVKSTSRKLRLCDVIKAVQKIFFSKTDPTFGWLYSKSLGINNFDRLSELDAYCKDCIRATITGSWNYTHNLKQIPEEKLRLAGYVSLVHMAKLAQTDRALYETEHLLRIKQNKFGEYYETNSL